MSCIIYGNYTKEGEKRLERLENRLDQERMNKNVYPKSRTNDVDIKNSHNLCKVKAKELISTYFSKNYSEIVIKYKHHFNSLAPHPPRHQYTQSVMPPLSIDTVPERNRVESRVMKPKFIM